MEESDDHPREKFLSSEFMLDRKNVTLNEWLWYFIQRIAVSPERRYEEERNPTYGWNHTSDIHSIEEPCMEGCRFWQKEGKIEDTEVLKDYEIYDSYNEVLKIWTQQRQ